MDNGLFPRELIDGLDEGTAGALLRLAGTTRSILEDNKLPFFPNYTDHGATHIKTLLTTIVDRLIPQELKQRLTAADITVLLGATLLHDIGMYLREDGFLKLISGTLQHRPIPWFDTSSSDRKADLPWPEEWSQYRQEIRRFSDRDFSLLIGHIPPIRELSNWFDHDLPSDPRLWSQIDLLLIGEFVRRCHGRLAHEITMYGFPGLTEEEFPVLADLLPKYADLIGLVARSHFLPLREAVAYLDYKHPRVLRPRDCAAIYHMALLRVGDYLQLDSNRAPSILFKLRSPGVPPSVDAWRQHEAVVDISYMVDDPVAIKIELSGRHSLKTHLQLKYLIEGLQQELDTSSAVLSEVYGRVTDYGIGGLRLAKLRVFSNHQDPSLLSGLPYIPERITFAADPKILSLMVAPIYGMFPEFGIRELLQNSVDAVLEHRRYRANRGTPCNVSDDEILVQLSGDDNLTLTISDNGIGMTPNIVRDYFLRAGASFRDSRLWKEEYTDVGGASRVRRSGRFGVGVFAGFLLGEAMKVVTRHASSEFGLHFVVKNDSELIELEKIGAPVGTTISIRLPESLASRFVTEIWPRCPYWYALQDPKVTFEYRTSERVERLAQPIMISAHEARGGTVAWNTFRPPAFEGVSWTSDLSVSGGKSHEQKRRRPRGSGEPFPSIWCNGFLIGSPVADERYSWQEQTYSMKSARYSWSTFRPFTPPSLLIFDHEGALPLTVKRDELVGPLPFEQLLAEDIALDFIAWCLAAAPVGPVWDKNHGDDFLRRYPLLSNAAEVAEPLTWLCSTTGALPLDRHLLTQLGIGGLLAAATVSTGQKDMHGYRDDDGGSYTDVDVSIRGTWPFRAPTELDGVLALHLGNRKTQTRLHKDDSDISHSELQAALTESFVGHLGTARDSSEVELRGAHMLKGGPGGSAAEEIRAGEYVEARTNLSELLETSPRSTAYFAWGKETKSDVLEYRFLAELSVSPADGPSAISGVWSSHLGVVEIPFDAAARERLIAKACQSPALSHRYEKWSNSLRSSADG
jgi:hypothetical protein